MKATEPSGAVLSLLAAALCFSLMAICVKAVAGHLPVAEVVLARSVVSLAICAALLRGSGLDPWGQRRWLLLTRGLLGSLALACVFGALGQLPLATATVLQYLYPTLSALAGRLWLAERITRRLWLAIPLGWLGVLLVSGAAANTPFAGSPLANGAVPLAGVALAVVGAGLTALAYVSVRELGRSEHPLVIMLYFPLTSLPLCLPFVALDPVLPQGPEWAWLIGVGVFTQLGQMGLTWGLVRLPVAASTAIGYAQVPFAALWGWLLFHEPLSATTAGGAALILAATLLSLPGRT